MANLNKTVYAAVVVLCLASAVYCEDSNVQGRTLKKNCFIGRFAIDK